jgi:bifunctional DNase/RNase
MAELIVAGVRAETQRESAVILLKDPVTGRYLPILASVPASPAPHPPAPRSQPGTEVSVDLVQRLLQAAGASIRSVDVAGSAAGPDQLGLIVGSGLRVSAAPLEAIALATHLGLPIHCADAVLEAEGVPVGSVERPASADGLDATGLMELVPVPAIEDPTGPLVQPPAGVAILQIRQGPGAGAVFVLDDEVVGCGRDGTNPIVLDGATVSRKHAEFRRRGSQYVVSDLGSLNGTYVNGERVELAVLAVGDQIRIGRYVLSFATG